MSSGASGSYWEKEKLPSVLKHELLRVYLPKFAGKLGSTYGQVVLLDGYAGRGMYESGAPGSGLQMLKVADDIAGSRGTDISVFLAERDRVSFTALEQLVNQRTPSRAGTVRVELHCGDVSGVLPAVPERAAWKLLFAFLDPCGLLLPFNQVASLLDREPLRYGNATEVLVNFSADAVRRIGGHLKSPKRSEQTLRRMDEAVGGDWWRVAYVGDRDGDDAFRFVVAGYAQRLREATGAGSGTVDVFRNVGHKPVYDLIFASRTNVGLWYFSDAAARAQDMWWQELNNRDTSNDGVLPGMEMPGKGAEHRLAVVEAEAVDVVAENIASTLVALGAFTLGDEPTKVFGDYIGRVRETVARTAVKRLYQQKRTSCNGVGRDIWKLRITPPE